MAAALATPDPSVSDTPTPFTPASVSTECEDDGCIAALDGGRGSADGAAFSVSAMGRRCWYKFVPVGASQPLKRAPSTSGAHSGKAQYECRFCNYVSDR